MSYDFEYFACKILSFFGWKILGVGCNLAYLIQN